VFDFNGREIWVLRSRQEFNPAEISWKTRSDHFFDGKQTWRQSHAKLTAKLKQTFKISFETAVSGQHLQESALNNPED